MPVFFKARAATRDLLRCSLSEINFFQLLVGRGWSRPVRPAGGSPGISGSPRSPHLASWGGFMPGSKAFKPCEKELSFLKTLLVCGLQPAPVEELCLHSHQSP